MPPAVAHAPMVTRWCEAARMARIRSASAAVVTEPSTSDRSYGPGATALDASRKWAISTLPASARSSSSQSSRVSWQPSQEASLNTASVGAGFGDPGFGDAISQLPHGQQGFGPVPADDRTVPAQQHRAELA